MRLADEKKGHQGGDGTEDQQGHDLKVDSPLGAGRCCPDAVHVAGAREDLTLSYRRGGRSEWPPVGCTVAKTDADEIDLWDLLDGDSKPSGQAGEKGGGEVGVLLSLIGDVLLGRQGQNRVDVLRESYDRRDTHRERWTGRHLGADLGGVGESAVLELRGRVGVEVEVAADVEVTLPAASSLTATSKGRVGSGRCPATTNGRSTLRYKAASDDPIELRLLTLWPVGSVVKNRYGAWK